jgi:uncharacterized protein (DUF58 family)
MSRPHRPTRLTIRGRSFIAAGAAILTLGAVAGLTELVRIGVFVLVLPLGSLLWIALRQHALVLSRAAVPTHLPLGDRADVVLRVHNPGGSATGLLLMTEQVPAELGGAPRFAVESLRHGASHQVRYEIVGGLRGKYDVGPLEAELVDPFGFVERHEVFPGFRTVVVTPRVVPLPHLTLSSGPVGVGDRRSRQFLIGSADDSTVRDYRRGDDLRRVHWRSSAHHGELMVRSEEQPWRSRVTLILDVRTHAYPGPDGPDRLETAVSLAASIAVHLLRREFAVRLVTTDGTHLTSGWHDKRAAPAIESEILEQLALLPVSHVGSIAVDLSAGSAPGDLIVGVFGSLSETDRLTLETPLSQATRNLAFTTHGETGPGGAWIWEQVLPGDDLAAHWASAGAQLKARRMDIRESV